MKRLFFTAGPAQSYPTLETHLKPAWEKDILSINHRGTEFKIIYNSVRKELKDILGIPEEYEIFFFASANEIWERLIQNLVETTSFHFDNGAFGARFFWVAQQLKKKPLRYKVEDGESMKKRYPGKLIAVDCVSSLPYPQFDYSKLDAVYFSVQKGFGLPAGLGVCILSPAAIEKSRMLQQQGVSTGSYHSFTEIALFSEKSQTPETPNVLAIYLLWQVLLDMKKKGLETIRQETEDKADMLYRYFRNHHSWKPFVKKEADRSKTIIVVDTGDDTERIIRTLAKKNIEITPGYGDRKDTQIRISNFPAHTIEDVERLLEELERI